VADGVHPAMNGVQATVLDSPSNRPRSEARLEQLPPRHNAMLPPGELSNKTLIRPSRTLSTVCGLNARFGWHRAMLPLRGACGGSGTWRKARAFAPCQGFGLRCSAGGSPLSP
jgi:hypothetical protein